MNKSASQSIPIYLYVIPALLLACIIICTKYIMYSTIYSKLEIQKVYINGDKNNFELTYSIINKGNQIHKLPKIKIQLIAEDGSTAKSHITNNINGKIDVGEEFFIRTEFDNITKKIEKINIILGDRMNLFFADSI